MSEEKVAENTQTPDTPEVTPTISETELEQLKANSAILDGLNATALEMGFASHQEYQSFLEQQKYNEIQENGKTPDVKVTPTTKEEPVKQPEPVQQVQQPDQLAVQAYLKGDYAIYSIEQSQLPEAERGTYTQAQLNAVVSGPKGVMIQGMLADPEFNNNVYSAAQFLLDVPKNKKEAQQKATETTEALEQAKETATVSKSAPPPENKQEKSDLEKEADSIAQDDNYVYPE